MAKTAQIKTKETEASVEDFLNAISDGQRRSDGFTLVKLMQKASKDKPKMWGSAIIGFGNKRFVSPNTGREVDWFKMGFSPRKSAFSLYLLTNMKAQAATLKKLGKHKLSGGCLHITKLADVDLKVLEVLFKEAMKGK